jgi:hypothetical protein
VPWSFRVGEAGLEEAMAQGEDQDGAVSYGSAGVSGALSRLFFSYNRLGLGKVQGYGDRDQPRASYPGGYLLVQGALREV